MEIEDIHGLFCPPSENKRGLICWFGPEPSGEVKKILNNAFYVFSMDWFYPNSESFYFHNTSIDWSITISEEVLKFKNKKRPVFFHWMFAARMIEDFFQPINSNKEYDLIIPHRLDEEKNWDLLIDNYKIIKDKKIIILFQRYKDSENLIILEKKINSIKDTNIIIRKELINRLDFAELLSKCRYLLMMSFFEGESRVCHEIGCTGGTPLIWKGTKSLIKESIPENNFIEYANFHELKNILDSDCSLNYNIDEFRKKRNMEITNIELKNIAEDICQQSFDYWINKNAFNAFYYPHVYSNNFILKYFSKYINNKIPHSFENRKIFRIL